METPDCDLCGSRESDVCHRRDTWTLVRCRGCGLVFLSPRPEPDVIEKDFDWFRHSPLQTGARRKSENPVRRWLRKLRGKGILRRVPRNEVVRGRINEFIASGRFLDVGCGTGEVVDHMERHGFESHGLDISDDAIAIARARGTTTITKGTIHEAPWPDGHFDAILMMSVLEHEHRPAAALARARDLLRPGGCIFIKVPHYGCWNRVLMGDKWSGYFFPQHLYHFTPKTIAGLLQKAGLEVARNGFWDHVPVSDVLWATGRRPA